MRSFSPLSAVLAAFSAMLVFLTLAMGPAAAAAPQIVQVESGDYFSCARDAEGGVWCWGRNDSGQLGDGTTTDRNLPARVLGLPPVRALAVGGAHACALLRSRQIRCWGGNWSGQLGNGETADAQARPVAVLDLRNVVAIAAGGGHSCAIDDRRRAWCWGENLDGQLGIGSNESFPVRARITALSGFAAIALGDESTCATTRRGIEACWGRNFSGMLGDGTTISRNEPAELVRDGLTGFSPAAFHTCAMNARGRAFCWGNNQWGQLGIGSFERSYTPVLVNTLSNVALVTTGRYHSCALTRAGRARCWGNNADGQLGDATLADRARPVEVFGSRLRFTHISAGTSHTCALRADAQVMCWGLNEHGQLGNRSNASSARPVRVRFP